MNAEMIRKIVKRSYEDKLNSLTDENSKLRKENEELRRENEEMRKRTELLDPKENQWDKLVDTFMSVFEPLE